MSSSLGLAQIKPEGFMVIPIEYIEDDRKPPMLPNKIVCCGVMVGNTSYTRKEYAKLLIKQQPYF